MVALLSIQSLFSQTNCESARKEYLEKNPDVKKAGMDPWTHFTYYGKNEGRVWANCITDGKKSLNQRKNSVYENEYVKIVDQYWTNFNLNVSFFNNGDSIQYISDSKAWYNAGINRVPAWCYFNNDPSLEKSEGKLYNIWAIVDPRGITPDGWRIATKEDWIILLEKNGNTFQSFPTTYSMQTTNIGGFKTNSGWDKYPDYSSGKEIFIENNGTNSKRLSIYPSGRRSFTGDFSKPNILAEFWTTTKAPSTPNGATQYFSINVQNNQINIHPEVYSSGFAVRCVSNDIPPKIENSIIEPNQNEIISNQVTNNSVTKTTKTEPYFEACTFKFTKPTNLSYKYIDNRILCCYCKEKYVEYEEKSNMVNYEQALYIAEKLYLHFQDIGADEAHQNSDRNRMLEFFLSAYPGNENLLLGLAVGYNMQFFPLLNLTSNLGSTTRKIEKYKVNGKFCSPKCQNECNYFGCKCN
jgi:uncharacterized protein (TIGR02145 family)